MQASERTNRKREAGQPNAGGIPSKLTVSSASHLTGTTNSISTINVSILYTMMGKSM